MSLVNKGVKMSSFFHSFFQFKEIFSVSLILFSVIDILGSIPIVIELRKKTGKIQSTKATIVAGLLMIIFLYLGETLLNFFGLDIGSFAIAGAVIMFLVGLEMILNTEIFKHDPEINTVSIVPIAFPLLAGAGTMTTLISLRAEYDKIYILIGIFLNLFAIFAVLKSSDFISRILGKSGTQILRKVFGIILLAIAIKFLKKYI